ncbi:MAG: hypothetical protein JXR49_17555 [Acidobacteria bacterium]|nr:hypothetical protein [Acidobacteriota bacterium]
MNDFFFTKGDIAKKSQMSGQGVLAAVHRGELKPAARTMGGIMLFDRKESERFIESRIKNRK